MNILKVAYDQAHTRTWASGAHNRSPIGPKTSDSNIASKQEQMLDNVRELSGNPLTNIRHSRIKENAPLEGDFTTGEQFPF